ncbi:cell surface pattern recognition receptor signaling pathway [Branchiostoma belcheri]|nr:cell surface pattern recognition receptor signaling pathway [Branchiostoma belcheri]
MSTAVLLALLALLHRGAAGNVKNLPEILHQETAAGGKEVSGQITLHCPAQPTPSCPALDHLLLYLSAQDSLGEQLEHLKNRTDSLDRQQEQLRNRTDSLDGQLQQLAEATVSSQDIIIQQQAAALQQREGTLQQLETTNQQQASTLQQLETTNQQQASSLQQQAATLQQLEVTLQQQEAILQQQNATLQQQDANLQQLQTTNQQQASSLQQLETINQQQASSLQQLETTNQQQASTLQQQAATLQQLDATLQQLQTTNQQQASSLQQLEATLQQQEPTLQQHATTLQQCTTELQQLEDRVTVPRTCMDLLNSGHNTSGVYTIYPAGEVTSPIRVYCDMDTDGGGWVVFQRRKDGSVDFFLGWQQYKAGFGDLTGEFWLGNDNLHRLTTQGWYELRVDLEDFEGNSAFAKYSNFRVENEWNKYRLTVGGYSGTAGDAMSYHSSMFFSTKDERNDFHPSINCAQHFKGGWWYNSCHFANLNGLYLGGAHHSFADGMNWKEWKGQYYSLKHTEMKIRPN